MLKEFINKKLHNGLKDTSEQDIFYCLGCLVNDEELHMQFLQAVLVYKGAKFCLETIFPVLLDDKFSVLKSSPESLQAKVYFMAAKLYYNQKLDSLDMNYVTAKRKAFDCLKRVCELKEGLSKLAPSQQIFTHFWLATEYAMQFRQQADPEFKKKAFAHYHTIIQKGGAQHLDSRRRGILYWSLACLYARGLGSELGIDTDRESIKCLKRLAISEDFDMLRQDVQAVIYYKLARYYLEEGGSERVKAFEYFQKTVDHAGLKFLPQRLQVYAYYRLAGQYLGGGDDEQAKAFEYYQKAADHVGFKDLEDRHQVDIYYHLANLSGEKYRREKGEEASKRSVNWAEKASNHKCFQDLPPEARVKIGWELLHGGSVNAVAKGSRSNGGGVKIKISVFDNVRPAKKRRAELDRTAIEGINFESSAEAFKKQRAKGSNGDGVKIKVSVFDNVRPAKKRRAGLDITVIEGINFESSAEAFKKKRTKGR